MKRIIILFYCLLVTISRGHADNVHVSVLTCSPGDEAYSLFGHTGLRYRDADNDTDIVFSYGYFDFSAPGFIWRFILGETDYMVGAVPYHHFISEYEERGSGVVEQEIALSPEQKNSVIDFLAENCKEENRVYRYNYFYNNCTTKVRDLLFSVVGGITYQGDEPEAITFREVLSRLTGKHPWYAFGINLLLGADVDEPASRHELQFIPGYFMQDADKAVVTLPEGNPTPFVKEKIVLLDEQSTLLPKSHFTPFNISLLVLLATMIVMLCEVRRKRTYWVMDILLMLVQGLSGVLLLFMALFSAHPAVGNNWVIILLNPLALLILPVMLYRNAKGLSMQVAWLQVFVVTAFFISAILGIQVYPIPLYFFAIALSVRALFHIYKKNICELNLF